MTDRERELFNKDFLLIFNFFNFHRGGTKPRVTTSVPVGIANVHILG